MPSSASEPMRLAARWQRAPAMATAPGGEGILPSLAPTGAHAFIFERMRLAARWQRALAIATAPWGRGHLALARADRRACLHLRTDAPSGAMATRPCNRDGPLGTRASCPRSRRQARMASSASEPMRLTAHSEGKMPSPPGAPSMAVALADPGAFLQRKLLPRLARAGRPPSNGPSTCSADWRCSIRISPPAAEGLAWGESCGERETGAGGLVAGVPAFSPRRSRAATRC